MQLLKIATFLTYIEEIVVSKSFHTDFTLYRYIRKAKFRFLLKNKYQIAKQYAIKYLLKYFFTKYSQHFVGYRSILKAP